MEKDINKPMIQKYSRTDKLIMNAFVELLNTKPIEKIDVNEICEKALIKRATFYNHFESKDHLFHELITSIEENLYLSIIENSDNYSLEEMLNKIAKITIDFLGENKEKFALLIKGSKQVYYYNVVLESTNRSIKYFIQQNREKLNIEVPSEVISRFFTGGIANLSLWWITDDNCFSKEKILEIFNNLIKKVVQLVY